MGAYLGGADILASPLDSAGFNAPLGVDARVPRCFDQVLDLEHGRQLLLELLITLEPCTNHIRGDHLNVAIPAEPTYKSRESVLSESLPLSYRVQSTWAGLTLLLEFGNVMDAAMT